MGAFWQRLKQRKLVQWAVAYVAFAFALLQGIDIVAQQFGWPEGLRRGITLALVIGFFVVLVLAWYHGERGAQRVGGTELVIIGLLLAVGGSVLWMFARAPAAVPAGAMPAASAASSAGTPDLLAVITADVPERSVAVLPFANESGKQDEQYFSDGLSEDLITALSQFDGLKVISRNSAFQFRDSKDSSATIGRLLGVAHLLEGTVRRGGDAVRITATLVSAVDGRTLWSEKYDRPYKDLFALQDAITQAVAGQLKSRLMTAPGAVVQNDRPPSGNLAAYTSYQQGKAYDALGNEAGWRQAIDAYNEAIRLDPKYVAAHAGLSEAWRDSAAMFLGGAAAAQANAKARAAVATALALDPGFAPAHSARAWLFLNDMDWKGAEAEFRRALELAPHDAGARHGLGTVLATLGQVNQAVDLTRQALASDPRHASWYNWLAIYFSGLGRPDEARQAIETAIALQPGAAWYRDQLAVIEILRGEPEAALAAVQQEPPGNWRDFAMALATQVGHDRTAADAALKTLMDKHADAMAYQVADVYALRKDPDNMFRWLDRAWTVRDPGVGFLLMDPLILRYQHDPRFAAFAKKAGLPITTDALAMR